MIYICRGDKLKKKVITVLWILLMFCVGCGDNIDTLTPTRTQQDTSSEKQTAGKTQEENIEELETVIEAAEQDDIVTITISATGDVTLGNAHTQEYSASFRQMYDSQKDKGYFFQNVKDIFEADDMTIVNFEGVLTFSETRQEKDYNMKGDPEYVEILTKGSVEVVSFGNNHRLDYLSEGSNDTIKAFDEAGIVYAYDKNVGIFETKGIKIGIISVNEVSQGTVVEKYIEEGIEKLKEQEADIILACCHWGIEGDNYPEEYQTTLGRKCIDLGADLVIGHHPHVLQGIEEYNKKYIIYSLGNFCFGGNRNPVDKDTLIFQQSFTFINGEKQEKSNIKIIPCSLSSVKNRNNFQPTPAKEEEAERIIDRINLYSKEYGVSFDYQGMLN